MHDCTVKSVSTGGEIRLLSRVEVVEQRRQLTRLIDGDVFFPLKSWPKEMRLIFWKKNQWVIPKLVLFLIGNGCEPSLIGRWTKAEKGARQVDFVLNNADQKRHLWFYFDVDYNKLLYLNGLLK